MHLVKDRGTRLETYPKNGRDEKKKMPAKRRSWSFRLAQGYYQPCPCNKDVSKFVTHSNQTLVHYTHSSPD